MHCKDVSVREVDFSLTYENIVKLMETWTSYVRTEGLVLRNGNDHAAVEIIKTPGTGLFRRVQKYSILSLPKDTVYIEDKNFDVINIPALSKLQSQHPDKTVVIKGMFSHINFIKDMEPIRLTVIDNIPPEPSKLSVLVKMALASGFIDKPVITDDVIIDLADMVPKVKTEAVMFPCKVSELKAPMPVYFLDESPELIHDVTLIGCHLSKRIFQELYRKDVAFLNVCPADFTDGRISIVKCCKVKDGYVIDGNVVKVPWGATVPEVVQAINAIFSK